MIKQQSMILSLYMELYNLVVPKDNMLRQISDSPWNNIRVLRHLG